jgi:alpha-L-arabinofuranosidase
MEMMVEMNPKFLRFPGGNYLEGNNFANRFDWKQTIGNPDERPGHQSPWGYRSTDGLGLLEFLQWAEDIGGEPVVGVFAGYVLNGDHLDGDYVKPFIQDALDEIEYIIGDAQTTKWGAVRARDGHPAPFPLHYVEIGNEDFFDRSGSYPNRFKMFYEAIKARYPQLQIISTVGFNALKSKAIQNPVVDVIDEHYYRNAFDMYRNAFQYDRYDRTGPKIFCGEWATREGTPTTNMNAALGENVEAAIDGKYYTYTIVGVYEYNAKSMGAAGVADKDLETECFVPLRAVVQQNPQLTDSIQEITLVASEGNDPTITAAQIAKYLNERYYKNNDTYEIYPYSLKQEAEALQKLLNSVKLAFLAVGAISLLVGGIGVMNIMIVSIVERTREIGTSKALGATNGSIWMQFITESMVVCLVGGAIGITLGILLGQVAGMLLGANGMPSVLGILGCLLFSMAFGVFFGYYPANRAAKLNPIEALRYE